MNQNFKLRILRPLLLITPILLIFFFGCSKNVPHPDQTADDSEFVLAENVGEVDSFSDLLNLVKKKIGLLTKDDKKAKTPELPEQLQPDIGAEHFQPKSKAEQSRPEKIEGIIASLPREAQGQQLSYRTTDHLQDIHFVFNNSKLDDKSKAILQENAAYLKVHPLSKVEIQGYCDSQGSNNYNISLGEQRANAVKSYLMQLQIDESRIHTISFGEEKPLCVENDEECRHQNSRVSFLISE